MFDSRNAVNCAGWRLGLGPLFGDPLPNVDVLVIVALIPNLDRLGFQPWG